MIGLANVGYYKLLSKQIAIHRKLQSSDSRPIKTALILYFSQFPAQKEANIAATLYRFTYLHTMPKEA